MIGFDPWIVTVIYVFFLKPTSAKKSPTISFYCIRIVLLFVQSKFHLKQPISIAEKYRKLLINRYITTEQILILSRDEKELQFTQLNWINSECISAFSTTEVVIHVFLSIFFCFHLFNSVLFVTKAKTRNKIDLFHLHSYTTI